MKKIITLCFICYSTFAISQIQHVDYGEEGYSIPMNADIAFDVNEDGITDFYINRHPDELGVNAIFAIGCFASPSESAYTAFGARELDVFEEGDFIQLNGDNMFDYIDEDERRASVYTIDNTYAADWEDQTPQLIGFAVFAGLDVLNGWMRISVDEASQSLILHEYAYHTGSSGLEGFIEAGDTGLTSVENLLSSASVSVYPNPTSEILNIELDQSLFSDVEISVVSQTGALVLKTSVNAHQVDQLVSLNITELPVGSYLLNLRTEAGVQSKNFMVKR